MENRRAIATWCMEVSALLAVFPAVEILVREHRLDPMLLFGLAASLSFLWTGLYLNRRG